MYRDQNRKTGRPSRTYDRLGKRLECPIQVIEYLKQIQQSGHPQSLDHELGRIQEFDGSGALLGGG